MLIFLSITSVVLLLIIVALGAYIKYLLKHVRFVAENISWLKDSLVMHSIHAETLISHPLFRHQKHAHEMNAFIDHTLEMMEDIQKWHEIYSIAEDNDWELSEEDMRVVFAAPEIDDVSAGFDKKSLKERLGEIRKEFEEISKKNSYKETDEISSKIREVPENVKQKLNQSSI